MSRLQGCFEALRAARRKALVCFITAGDGGVDTTLASMHAMVEAGADVIELGVPFSDPMADGPTIQQSSERALAGGLRVDDVFATVRRFRGTDQRTPVVLMGYANPVEARGAERFAADAATAGVDGIITVDLPPEEGEEHYAAFRQHGLDPIFLIAPNTAAPRIASLCAGASGFVYFVAIKGVTGSHQAQVSEVAASVAQIRAATDLPVCVGFGIRDAEAARAMAEVCDAVIVGSALVQCFADLRATPEQIPAQLGALVADLRGGVDQARG